MKLIKEETSVNEQSGIPETEYTIMIKIDAEAYHELTCYKSTMVKEVLGEELYNILFKKT